MGTVAVAGTGYGFFESTWVRIDRQTLAVRNLPAGFRGLTVAFLTDIHHGPYVDLDFVRHCVRTANLLDPDLILLGGDYVHRDGKYAGPCFEALAGLKAPLGVYGVLGNHDYWNGVEAVKAGFRSAKITELTNSGVWLTKNGDRLRLGGVDDLWKGTPDIAAALGDATERDACLVVSHNPDYAEYVRDRRVGLMLSGHTHGGQVTLPGVSPPWVPSAFGSKYLHGRVEAQCTTVYVSRGLGMTGLPVRVGSRPEINLISLA
jgi:predicted MPP superfamily phosphohydrolase